MSSSKDIQNDQDPDYATPGPSDGAHQKLFEETARTNVARKITAIVEKEFSKEIETKEVEIMQIEGRLHKALKTLHFLRYVIITDFYNRKQCQAISIAGESKQTRIHPAIKQVIGKAPRGTEKSSEEQQISYGSKQTLSLSDTKQCPLLPEVNITSSTEVDRRLGNLTDLCEKDAIASKTNGNVKRRENFTQATDEGPPKKIPRYVPPKSGIPEPQLPSRGARHKVRKRIIIGNISKWIPPDWREDVASHKWTMYVRGSKENADISDFVGKIRFFLHPSYRPNDVVEVTSPPFHLSRRGWGEFPVRVQLHFKSPLNKPMDVIHHLKLDRTYTGLQTLGSETVVDIWIKTASSEATCDTKKINDNNDKIDNWTNENFLPDPTIKQEPLDGEKTSNNKIMTLKIPSCSEKIKTEKEIKDEIPSHVYLDHDYVNFSDSNIITVSENENNVTISHSPSKKITRDEKSSLNFNSLNGDSERRNKSVENSTPTIPSKEIFKTRENDVISKGIENDQKVDENLKDVCESTTLYNNGEPEVSDEISSSIQRELDGINIRTSQDVKTMASNLEYSSSKLQPLKIAIPAAFEALKKNTKVSCNQKKQILVMRDNKLIPVDSINLPKNSSKKIGPVVSTIVSDMNSPKNNAPRSNVSLLKRSIVEKNKMLMLTLNPNNSLLLNSSNNIPALKIVEPSTLNNRRLHLTDKQNPHRTSIGVSSKMKNKVKESSSCENWIDNYKLLSKPKITLGKDRIGTTSKKNNYEEILRSIDDVRITDVSSLVRFIIRRIPLITEKATDPEYRILHPYACASETEFLDNNIGKQRALEWYRAKRVQSFIKKKRLSDNFQWTIKEIMIWSRLHGYTPIRSSSNIAFRTRCEKSSNDHFPTEISEAKSCTFTEPSGLLKFLRVPRENKPTMEDEKKQESEIEIIDVESIVVANTESGIKKEKTEEKKTLVSLGVPEKIVALQSYVCDTTRHIGIKLEPEEIVPGVMHCAAARMMVRAVQCLLEDLLRSSFAKAWERSIDGRCPDSINLEDVRGAILNREEFDLFTNEGLGSHHCPYD